MRQRMTLTGRWVALPFAAIGGAVAGAVAVSFVTGGAFILAGGSYDGLWGARLMGILAMGDLAPVIAARVAPYNKMQAAALIAVIWGTIWLLAMGAAAGICLTNPDNSLPITGWIESVAGIVLFVVGSIMGVKQAYEDITTPPPSTSTALVRSRRHG